MKLQTIQLKEYFDKINYNWEKDLSSLRTICHFTKTRVKPAMEQFTMLLGNEQPFLLKAVAEFYNVTSFFEIGTGRGTACYSLSLIPSVEAINTIDIIPFKQKQNTAIGFRPATVSNEDIYNMIPFPEKEKILFFHRSQVPFLKKTISSVEMSFIDGNHSDPDVIMQDFDICHNLTKPGGLIIFDDYHPARFAVKMVVDHILENEEFEEATLVTFHGHLFDQENKHLSDCVLILKKK